MQVALFSSTAIAPTTLGAGAGLADPQAGLAGLEALMAALGQVADEPAAPGDAPPDPSGAGQAFAEALMGVLVGQPALPQPPAAAKAPVENLSARADAAPAPPALQLLQAQGDQTPTEAAVTPTPDLQAPEAAPPEAVRAAVVQAPAAMQPAPTVQRSEPAKAEPKPQAQAAAPAPVRTPQPQPPQANASAPAQPSPAMASAPAEAAPPVVQAEAAPVKPADRPASRADSRGRAAVEGQPHAAAGDAAADAVAAAPPAGSPVPSAKAVADDAVLRTSVEADSASDAPDLPAEADAQPTPASAPAPAATTIAAGHTPKAEPLTFAHLSAQIVQKLSAKVTRFDLELLPAGLGKVDVKVEISASGALTAALSFDNPHAQAELRGRADELKAALQQAGFDLSDNGLSFDLSGQQNPRWAQQGREDAAAFAGRAFAAASNAADDLLATVAEAAARYERRGDGALDIRI